MANIVHRTMRSVHELAWLGRRHVVESGRVNHGGTTREQMCRWWVHHRVESRVTAVVHQKRNRWWERNELKCIWVGTDLLNQHERKRWRWATGEHLEELLRTQISRQRWGYRVLLSRDRVLLSCDGKLLERDGLIRCPWHI